ncbi:protocatechuate 3,4-dioxygenase [Roseimicrobium sp. ORNL1]|uniref:dioxygenase family protein n=1 Tax=Roseimicrobium sp. ORNL1 TaxID=2711231 RepID=UPI0013E100DF|nr:protocatechuate 3,4-dioxygenase [Roseimicrobium sp. ORNL1]QIF05063.1 intradiol ring-cleavage dioxygenase [Roseimicrobium sp. ORNL1]
MKFSSLCTSAASRRHLLRGLALSAAGLWVPGAFAEALTLTPRATEGPFYPDKLPLDQDNDLIVIKDSTSPAVGEVTYLSGRVLDPKGNPLKNAVVEIWQCDANGVYLHSRSGGNVEKRDGNFQGFGKFETDSTGGYLFRTIKPVPYPGRTPHIHMKVKLRDKELLTTQIYVKGIAQNDRDGIWKKLPQGAVRDSVTVAFSPKAGAKAGELEAKCDIIVGLTPGE